MAMPVVSGATIACTLGAAPGQLTATSQTNVLLEGKPAATIQDAAPMSNVAPCGMCTSLMNPAVAAATAAAFGVLTPMPCTPSPSGAWVCSDTPSIGGINALSNEGTLQCAFGGTIKITAPGQSTVQF